MIPRQNTTEVSSRAILLGAVSLFIFCILLTPSLAVLNDAHGYWSFENFPAYSVTDYSSFGYNLAVPSSGMATTASFLGDWALFSEYYTPQLNIYGDTGSGAWNLSDSTSFNFTYSFWVKYGSNDAYQNSVIPLFSDGDTYNAGGIRGIRMWINNNSQIIVSSNCHDGSAESYVIFNKTLQPLTWYHIVLTTDNAVSSTRIDEITLYIDNVEQPVDEISSTIGSFSPYSDGIIVIGDVESVRGECTDFPSSTHRDDSSGAYKIIDEFARYNRTLTDEERGQLYQNGYGYNPYSTDIPSPKKTLDNVQLRTESDTIFEYADYFKDLTYVELHFIYPVGGTEYTANSSQGVATDDFAIEMWGEYTAPHFYSFSEQTGVTLSVKVCNPNGCYNTTQEFIILGIGVPTQIKAYPDISLNTGETVSFDFSKYFDGYSRPFFRYTPENGTEVYVSTVSPHNGSCIDVYISGQKGYIHANDEKACTISDMRPIVDDEIQPLIGDRDMIVTVKVSKPPSGLLNVFSILPNAEDLSTSAKFAVPIIVMLITLLIGGYIMMSGGGAIAGVGSGIMLILEIIYFSLTGYIPMWITISIFIVAVLAVAAIARLALIGGGNGA